MSSGVTQAATAAAGPQPQRYRQHEKPDSAPVVAGATQRATRPCRPPHDERQSLVTHHLDLVNDQLRARLRRVRGPTSQREREDLFQEGCMALVSAAAQYDPRRHGGFEAYAGRCIRGAIIGALVRNLCIVRPPARRRPQDHLVFHSRYESLSLRDHSQVLAIDRPIVPLAATPPDTIRHQLRRRFERAVYAALAELRHRRWPRRNPYPVLVRIAHERLLIDEPAARTPIREIGRQAGVPHSRVGAYEQELLRTIHGHFASDPQVPLLVRFANRDKARFDGYVTARRRRLLRRAELEAFEARFAALGPADQAELLYDMVRKSTLAVTEVARNLYRLTGADEGC